MGLQGDKDVKLVKFGRAGQVPREYAATRVMRNGEGGVRALQSSAVLGGWSKCSSVVVGHSDLMYGRGRQMAE